MMNLQTHSGNTVQPGLSAEVEISVSESETAAHLGSGLVPVYATPALVALLENASVRALDGILSPGQTSVGGQIDLRHLAATPVGMKVRARAELTEVHGRKLIFRVQAWDEVEQIGDGSHVRFIIDEEAFMAKVNAKWK
jgi:predicted thioesterase